MLWQLTLLLQHQIHTGVIVFAKAICSLDAIMSTLVIS